MYQIAIEILVLYVLTIELDIKFNYFYDIKLHRKKLGRYTEDKFLDLISFMYDQNIRNSYINVIYVSIYKYLIIYK